MVENKLCILVADEKAKLVEILTWFLCRKWLLCSSSKRWFWNVRYIIREIQYDWYYLIGCNDGMMLVTDSILISINRHSDTYSCLCQRILQFLQQIKHDCEEAICQILLNISLTETSNHKNSTVNWHPSSIRSESAWRKCKPCLFFYNLFST